MKKRNIAKAFTAVLVTAAAAFALFACDDGTQPPVKYTATYVSGATTATGTAPASVEKAEGETFTIANNTFTNEGYDFGGWSYGSTTYAAGDTFTMPASNVEFKAVWTAQGSSVTEYTVTYAKGADEATGDVPASVQKAAGAKFELPAVGTLANEGYTFAGWSDGENVYAAEAEYTMPAKAVTLTALWKLEEYGIADMLGVYAGDDMTLTVSDVEFTGFGAGGIYTAVTNGKSFTLIGVNDDFGWVVSDMTSQTNYAIDYNSATEELTLIVCVYDEETESMVATNEKVVLAKTADYELAEAADFAGRYTVEVPAMQAGQTLTQMWLVNDDGTAVYGKKAEVDYTIVGNYLMITDMSFATSNYILTLNEGNLQGYMIKQNSLTSAFAFTDLAFTESDDVLTLTVNGEFNQLVLKGEKPSAITEPAAPDNTKEFDKWVLTGTTTEFDPTANMTADASITATFKDKPAPATPKTYVGNCTYTFGSGFLATSCTYTQFTISADATTVTYNCSASSSELTAELTDSSDESNKPSGADKFYMTRLQYGSKAVNKANFYLAISADGNTLTLCDEEMAPLDGGTFTLQTSGGGTTPVMPTYNCSTPGVTITELQFDNDTGKLVVGGTTYSGTAVTNDDLGTVWEFSTNPFGSTITSIQLLGTYLYVWSDPAADLTEEYYEDATVYNKA